MKNDVVYPYTAIAGQEMFKLAIELILVDKSIGGLLVLGDKGTGKTTTLRSLSHLMNPVDPEFKFVNLPVGASEDRVLGALDLEKLINDKKQVLQQGLLAQANRGILYIDEINLLNDYLTDTLLDAAATGGYYLERDGLSLWQESRFNLVGSMNPEEGELRPQLLDRFGLCVEVTTPQDLSIRMLITRRRMDFDSDAPAFIQAFAEKQEDLRQRIITARKMLDIIDIPDAIYNYASQLCLKHGVEGMRADILLIKAGRAYASLSNEEMLTEKHINVVAPFILKHRSKNQPTPPADGTPSREDNSPTEKRHNEQGNTQLQALPVDKSLKFFSKSYGKTKRGANTPIGSIVPEPARHNRAVQKIDALKSVRNYTATGNFQVIYKPQSGKADVVVYLLIDSSSSMAHDNQVRYVKGLVNQTINNNKGKRISFTGIGLVHGTAVVFQPATLHPDKFMHSLEQLETGGKTNLTEGLARVSDLMKQHAHPEVQQQLYIFTDGKVNAARFKGNDPFTEAISFYRSYLSKISYTRVIDTEKGFVKLGRARELAKRIHVKYSVI